jgi:hypothetical protein
MDAIQKFAYGAHGEKDEIITLVGICEFGEG